MVAVPEICMKVSKCVVIKYRICNACHAEKLENSKHTNCFLTCSLGGSGHPEILCPAVRGFFPPVIFGLMSAVFYC